MSSIRPPLAPLAPLAQTKPNGEERPQLAMVVHRQFRLEITAEADTREHIAIVLREIADQVQRGGTGGEVDSYAFGFAYDVREDPTMTEGRYYEMKRHAEPAVPVISEGQQSEVA